MTSKTCKGCGDRFDASDDEDEVATGWHYGCDEEL